MSFQLCKKYAGDGWVSSLFTFGKRVCKEDKYLLDHAKRSCLHVYESPENEPETSGDGFRQELAKNILSK